MRRVAVIGAGISGLFAIKACLEEGLEPYCFERTDQLGGIWVYRDSYTEGDPAGVYQGLQSNTSVYNHEASDYPSQVSNELPSWEEQLHYTQQFAKHYQLENYVKFNSEVISVVPDDDYWIVKWRNGDKVDCDRFFAVFVCTGRFHRPIVPVIDGREKFKGHFMTANAFKKKEQEEVSGKRVLIVGNSFTAGDIAYIIAGTADKVYLSIGKGCSLVSVCVDEVPLDTLALNRGVVYSRKMMNIFTKMMNDSYNTAMPDQEQYGISLYGAPLMARPTLYTSHNLASKLRSGDVLVKPQLRELTESCAAFTDGTAISVDTVIIATGYDVSFPFLSKDIVADTVGDLELYKLMWPLTTKHQNLAFIGCVKIIGSYTPFTELQTRWAAMVVQGKCCLPDESVMRNEIKARTAAVIQWFGKSVAQTEMPVLLYQDFMASEIGALPTWWHYLLTNPLLAYILRYGPAFPSTYRLVGPHSDYDQASQRTLQLYRRWRRLRGNQWTYGQIILTTSTVVGVAAAAAFLCRNMIRN